MTRNTFESIELARQVTLLSITYEDEHSISESFSGRSRFRSSGIAFFFTAIVMVLTMQSHSVYENSIPRADFTFAINSRSPRYWISTFAFVVKRARLPRISPSSPPPPSPLPPVAVSPPSSRHLHTFSC